MAIIARPTITRSPLSEPDCYDHFSQSLNNTDLCRPSLVAFLKSIREAKAPERFTTKFLVQLGYKSTNDRLFIGMLKALKFIDEAGVPTQRYFEFLDETRSAKMLADGIKEAYEDLFKINVKANELSVDEVKNKLKTLTQGQKSDVVIRFMANTFKALSEEADWSDLTPESVSEPAEPVYASGAETKAVAGHEALETKTPSGNQLARDKLQRISAENLGLHYNIQIILPDSRDPAVFDAIFRSLKEHLF